jgi:hypothetical protein
MPTYMTKNRIRNGSVERTARAIRALAPQEADAAVNDEAEQFSTATP